MASAVPVPLPCLMHSTWRTASTSGRHVGQKPWRALVAVEPDDRLARGAWHDGHLPVGRPTRLAQRVEARLWRGRGHRRHSAQPSAALLGHAQSPTTAIYADAVGAEEKDIASRM